MQRRIVLSTALAALAIGGITFTSIPANAAPPPSPSPNFLLQKGSNYVVANPAAAVKIDSDTIFYPTGTVSSRTLVVIPNDDGSLPQGITMQSIQAAAAALSGQPVISTATFRGPAVAAMPALYGLPYSYLAYNSGYSDPVTGGGVLQGSGDTVIYKAASCCTGQLNSHQALGYYKGYSGSVYGTYAKWYQIPASNAQALVQADVPWATGVGGSRKLRAKCEYSVSCSGSWGP